MPPAAADATAPPHAAPAGHFLGSRDPRASGAAAWREDAGAFPASGVPGEISIQHGGPQPFGAMNRSTSMARLPYRDEHRALEQSCRSSSARHKSNGGSVPAPPDRSSLPHLRIDMRGKGSIRWRRPPQTMQRSQKPRRSLGRTRNRTAFGVVIAFPPSDGEGDEADREP